MTTYGFAEKTTAEKLSRFARTELQPPVGPVALVNAKGNGWILKTPAEGIEGRDDTGVPFSPPIPGKADCVNHIINGDGYLVPQLDDEGNDMTVEVHNIFLTAIAGDVFITAKNVGTFVIADAEDCG